MNFNLSEHKIDIIQNIVINSTIKYFEINFAHFACSAYFIVRNEIDIIQNIVINFTERYFEINFSHFVCIAYFIVSQTLHSYICPLRFFPSFYNMSQLDNPSIST